MTKNRRAISCGIYAAAAAISVVMFDWSNSLPVKITCVLLCIHSVIAAFIRGREN